MTAQNRQAVSQAGEGRLGHDRLQQGSDELAQQAPSLHDTSKHASWLNMVEIGVLHAAWTAASANATSSNARSPNGGESETPPAPASIGALQQTRLAKRSPPLSGHRQRVIISVMRD